MFVIDAGVAAKWFVREALHGAALRLLNDRESLEAPDLIVPEVANIAWKKCIRGEIDGAQAEIITAAIGRCIPRLHGSTGLAERALEIALALHHPVYDCLYIACAERGDGVLVTADRRLCEAARGTGFGSRLRHLADLGV